VLVDAKCESNECNKSSTWDRRVRLWTQCVILMSVTRATWVDVRVDAKCVY
jgi:hypothetical protein